MEQGHRETESDAQSQVEFPDVNTTEGADEVLRRAVEAEKTNLRITSGQLAVLRAAKRDEEL